MHCQRASAQARGLYCRAGPQPMRAPPTWEQRRNSLAAAVRAPAAPTPRQFTWCAQDSLPESSKGVDSSSTRASCAGSNPTAVSADVEDV